MKHRTFLLAILKKIERLAYLVWLPTQLPLKPVEADNFVSYADWVSDGRKSIDVSLREIPKHVFVSWNENLFGRSHRKSLETACEANREWTFVFLSDAELFQALLDSEPPAEIPEFFERALFGQIKADIARIVLVEKYGGVWIDASKGFACPLSDLFGGRELPVLGYEKSIGTWFESGSRHDYPVNVVANWAFGAPPRSAFFSKLIQELVGNLRSYSNDECWEIKPVIVSLTGPGLFTKVVRRFFNDSREVLVMGPDFNEQAIWELRGSRARYGLSAPYGERVGSKLFSDSGKSFSFKAMPDDVL